MKKIIIFVSLSLILGLGSYFISILNFQDNTKFIRTQSGPAYVQRVITSRNFERQNLLKIHSTEVKKVSDYVSLNNHTNEEAVDYFTNMGWTNEAVLDSIFWSLTKAYTILASSKGVKDDEIFNTIKEMKPIWTEDYMQVLIEEILLDQK